MPSRKPYATGLSPTTAVRESGRIEETLSEEMSVRQLTTPSRITVEETRRTTLPFPAGWSAPGRSRKVTYTVLFPHFPSDRHHATDTARHRSLDRSARTAASSGGEPYDVQARAAVSA